MLENEIGDEEEKVRAYEAANYSTAASNLMIERSRLAHVFLSSEIQPEVGELTARLVENLVELSAQLGTVTLSRVQRANIFRIWRRLTGDALIAGEAIHNPITDPDEQIFERGSFRIVAEGGRDYIRDRLALSELSAEFKGVRSVNPDAGAGVII